MTSTGLEPVSIGHGYEGLWAGVAVLDERGVIVSTNATWDLFQRLNGGRSVDIGTNYIDVCERAGSHTVAHGLRSVLKGECAHFDLTYACPSPIEERWFRLEAAAIAGGVLVTHTNVTARMLTNDFGECAADDDPLTRLPTMARGLEMIDAALTESATSGIPTMIASVRVTALADIALSHGRLARDDVIIQVLARTRRLMRTGDFLVRTRPAVLMLVARAVDDRGSDQLLDVLTQVLAVSYQVGPFELNGAALVQITTSDSVTSAAAMVQHQPRPEEMPARTLSVAPVRRPAPDEIGTAIVGSPLPLVVFSLPDQRVRAANSAAADLFGLAPSELIHRTAKQLFQPDDRVRTTAALAALSSGAVESYRATRTLVGAAGPVVASIWVRAIPRRSGAMALLLVLPADHDDQFQLPARAHGAARRRPGIGHHV
ncbi:MAG: PAS domain-containing protein [Actinobacteria bacterium]|nr:PAS domain-containing protein [Actinomycetota bacterium]